MITQDNLCKTSMILVKSGSMKKIILFFLFACFPFFTHAQEVAEESLSQYKIDLPDGDRATLYFNKDHTLIFMPDFSNHSLVHICTAKWKINSQTSHLVISNANDCSVINGDFATKRNGTDILLQEVNRTLTLKAIQNE